MKPKRQRASELYEKLTNEGDGLSHRALLDYILENYMSGDEALDALQAAEDEFFSTESFDDEDEIEEYEEE